MRKKSKISTKDIVTISDISKISRKSLKTKIYSSKRPKNLRNKPTRYNSFI